jgi:hypothetical protein
VSCILFRHEHALSILIFSLAIYKDSVFFFVVCMFCASKSMLSAQSRRWCVPFSFSSSWFALSFQIAYFAKDLKSNDNKASPCFVHFWIKEMYQTNVFLCGLHYRFSLLPNKS